MKFSYKYKIMVYIDIRAVVHFSSVFGVYSFQMEVIDNSCQALRYRD